MPKKATVRWFKARREWRIYHNGKYVYLCKGAANEAKAWELAGKLKGDSAQSEKPPTTVPTATIAWLNTNGDDWHRQILRPFLLFGQGVALDDVHAEFLFDYLQHLRRNGYVREIKTKDKTKRILKAYSASTIRRQLRFARKVLQWAHVRKYMTAPVPPLPPLPKLDDVDRSLDSDTLKKLFAVLPKHAKQILAFQAITGSRPHEITELTYDEIHDDVVELNRGKTYNLTGKTRVIHLNDEAIKIIESQPTTEGYVFLNRNKKPHTTNGLRSAIRRAGKKIGINLSGSYLLRHTWAQSALDSGAITEAELGAALGHRLGSSATATYARIKDRRTKKATKNLPPLLQADQVLEDAPAKPPAKKKRRKTGQQNRSKTAKGRSRRQVG